tara:strand:+ start:1678 stop:4863 length:3186 start_codon:yes stop_codon:yes gene_type:complete
MANLQQKTQDTRDDIFNKYLSTKSPALDVTGTVDSDIFDVEGRTIRIPESAYKHYRKRSIRMPEKYVPIELRRPYGSSRPLPKFPEEGEMLEDWNIQIMPEEEGEKEFEFVDENETEYLNRMGIDTSGAPMKVVRIATWLPNDSFSITEGGGVEKVLRDYYPDATEADGSPWDFAIKQDPKSKRLIYRDPERGGQPQTLFAPGVQFSDVAAELPELIGEVGAGITTAALASPSGPTGMIAAGVGGEAFAAAGMRLTQLYRMRNKGYLSPRFDNDMTMVIEALKHGGMIGAFGLGGSALFGLARRIFNMAPITRNISPAIEWDKDVFIDAYKQVMGEAQEKGGTALEIADTLTAPQILLHSSVPGAKSQPASEYWQELSQMGSQGGREYDQIRKTLTEQDKIKERTLREQFGEGTEETLEDVIDIGAEEMATRGRTIQEAVETQIQPQVTRLETDILNLQREALETAETFVSGHTGREAGGVKVRESLFKVREAVNQQLDANYKEIEDVIGKGVVFDPTSLINWAKKQTGTINNDILPSLAVEDKRVLEDILNLAKVTEPGKGRKIGFPALRRAITQVNGLITKAKGAVQSGATTPELGFLFQLKGRLKEMRKQLLDSDTAWGKKLRERDPELIEKILEQERKYVDFQENYVRSLVGDVLLHKKSSGKFFEIGEESVVNSLIKNDKPVERRILKEILESSPAGLEGLEAIRSTVKGLYRREMRQAGTDDLRPLTDTQHDSFMKAYGDAMKEWLDPADFKKFQNAASAGKYVQAQIAGLEKSRKALAQYPWGSEALLDQPEELFELTFRGNRVTYSKNLKEALDKLEPSMRDDYINMYKGMIYRDFVKKSSDITKRAGGKTSIELDPRKVVKYLDEHGDQMAVWYGDNFAKGLNAWGDHLRALLPKGKSAVQITGDPKLKAGLDIVRAYVGIFTRPGRVITAALRLGKAGKEKAVIDALLNPGKLKTINQVDRFLSNPVTRAIVREILTFDAEQEPYVWSGFESSQLEARKSKGYAPEQTGTEEEMELFGPEKFSEISEWTTPNPTPFNTGGPARLIKLNHGY